MINNCLILDEFSCIPREIFKLILIFLLEFQSIYDRLDIKLVERGESYYQKHMEVLVKDLEEKNFLEEDEGRKIMWGVTRDGIPLTIIKRDGGFTYDTSDMAAIKQRIQEEKADWVHEINLLKRITK